MRRISVRKAVRICLLSAVLLFLGSCLSYAYEQQIRSLASTMAESIANAGKKTIAVVDFTDLQGNVTELGRFIAEELSVAIVGAAKGFEVVDRTHLKSILQEHGIPLTGLIDPTAARKLGQIAGVEVLVTGTITPFGDSLRLAAKVLDTTTAKIVASSAIDMPKTKAIDQLLAKGIEAAPQVTVGQATSSPKAKVLQRKEYRGFAFELLSCQISGSHVICYLSVTSIGEDRVLELHGAEVSGWKPNPSRILGVNVQREAISAALGCHADTWRAVQFLPADVPVRARLVFESVPQGVYSLEVWCHGEQDMSFLPFRVEFRDVAIMR